VAQPDGLERGEDLAARARPAAPCTELHHTARFRNGEDLLADQTTSSSLARGEWEHDAAQTVRSLVHYTIGLAIVAALIALFLRYRRRSGPVPTGHSELQQTGGAPTTSGL
jgi:hypothetical protein